MPEHNGLVTIRSGRDQINRNAADLLDSAQIADGIFRQLQRVYQFRHLGTEGAEFNGHGRTCQRTRNCAVAIGQR